ncbi:MAG: thioredoxin [Lachnospiraceae bacterium]|nr:thioredoxin [Lachnospiraceae bacterium]
MVKVINDDSFKAEVLEASTPVLVDFFATWCGPCKMMGPVLEKLSDKYEGKIAFAKIDVDENPDSAAEYNVRSIPFMVLFKDGQVVDHVLGAVPVAALEATLAKAL